MPTSPAGRANSRAGFTLVELLVVVSVLSILSLGVGLVGGGVFSRGGNNAGSLGLRLQGAVTSARDAALMGRAQLGLIPRAQGWQVVRRDADGAWHGVGARVFAADARLAWQIAGQAFLPAAVDPGPGDAPPIRFAADGGATGFAVTIGQGAAREACALDDAGALQCERR